MIRLKEDETSVNFGPDGSAERTPEGVFRRDTRYLRHYRWAMGDVARLLSVVRQGELRQHFARTGRGRSQVVAFERTLTMRSDGFTDVITVRNTSTEMQDVELGLEVEAEFADLFASVVPKTAEAGPIERRALPDGLLWTAVAGDGVRMRVTLRTGASDEQVWRWHLAPGETATARTVIVLSADDDPEVRSPLPTYARWHRPLSLESVDRDYRRALTQAVDDVRMLLLRTPHGLYPAAGMPWFVNIFGRDALIVSMMLLNHWPEVAHGVLAFLAEHRGRADDPFREEESGKILHEIRRGELSRTGRIPFGRYYGSVDATPLFVMTLAAYVDRTGDEAMVTALRPAWEGAIDWLLRHQGSDGGLVAFAPSGSGLVVQSWKDSADSMNHADGSPARAPLSVAEVQGYAFAAFAAAAGLYERLGEVTRAADLRVRASALQATFHRLFWVDRLDTYAMALDADGSPLEVLSSDPGHLLWTGIVPSDIAPRLVATLMGPALWSGWGLRTLGTGEARYNAVSYHNGSVWPHDTALFAWGLHRYGFFAEFDIVAVGLFDLAAAQPTLQLPELIAGTAREDGVPPTAYTHACCPQAWAAAALPLLAGLMHRTRDDD